MTKAEVIKNIEVAVRTYGFEFEVKGTYYDIKVAENNDDCWVGFTVSDCANLHVDTENRTYSATFEINSFIRRMGGNMTSEELFKVSQQLQKAATLVSLFDVMDLSYTESID